MLQRVWMGLVAGAAGTVALNVATYADMSLRGRASSSVPAKTAGKIAARAGVDLAPAAPAETPEDCDAQKQAQQ